MGINTKIVNLKDLKKANEYLDAHFVSTQNEITVNDKVYVKDKEGNLVLKDIPSGADEATVDETMSYLKNKIFNIDIIVEHGTYTGPTHTTRGKGGTVTFTPDSDYRLPQNISDITINNGTIESYNKDTGVLVFTNATGNVTITTSCPAKVFYVTMNVLNATFAGSTEVEIYQSTQITIIPEPHFIMTDSVTVTGAEYTFDKDTGIITIMNVTQNVTVEGGCSMTTGFAVIPVEEESYLLFTINGTVPGTSYDTIQYSYDGIHWTKYATESSKIPLTKDQPLYLRNLSNKFCMDSGNYCHVDVMTRVNVRLPYRVQGDLMSLLNYGEIYDACFAKSFWGTDILNMPQLPPPPTDTRIYPSYIFYEMFQACRKLKYLSEIPTIADLNSYEFYCMLAGCESLKISNKGTFGTFFFKCPVYDIEHDPKASAVSYMFPSVGKGEYLKGYPESDKSYYWYLSNTVTKTIVNGTFDRDLTELIVGKTEIIKILPTFEYTFPESVTVTGCSYTYNKNTGEITLNSTSEEAVSIAVECPKISSYHNFATDTFEEIHNQCVAGTHTARYVIGDEKVISINGVDHVFTVLDFNHDAPNTITIGLSPFDGYYTFDKGRQVDTNRWKSRFYMHTLGKPWNIKWASGNEIKGYNYRNRYTMPDSGASTTADLRHNLENIVLPYLKTSIGEDYIKTVNKPCAYCTVASSSLESDWANEDYSCQIFPYSEMELFGVRVNSGKAEGTQYRYFNKTIGGTASSSDYLKINNGNKMPAEGADSECYHCDVRSPNLTNAAYIVICNRNGGTDRGWADYAGLGVAFAIVIG